MAFQIFPPNASSYPRNTLSAEANFDLHPLVLPQVNLPSISEIVSRYFLVSTMVSANDKMIFALCPVPMMGVREHEALPSAVRTSLSGLPTVTDSAGCLVKIFV